MFTVLIITQEEKVNGNDLGIVNGDEVCGVEKLAKIPIFSKVASLAAAMVTVTSVEAQNRFGQLIDGAQREIITVTRYGRTAAFIVSPRDMEELLDARCRRSSAVAEMVAWSAKAKKSQSPAQASARAIGR